MGIGLAMHTIGVLVFVTFLRNTVVIGMKTSSGLVQKKY